MKKNKIILGVFIFLLGLGQSVSWGQDKEEDFIGVCNAGSPNPIIQNFGITGQSIFDNGIYETLLEKSDKMFDVRDTVAVWGVLQDIYEKMGITEDKYPKSIGITYTDNIAKMQYNSKIGEYKMQYDATKFAGFQEKEALIKSNNPNIINRSTIFVIAHEIGHREYSHSSEELAGRQQQTLKKLRKQLKQNTRVENNNSSKANIEHDESCLEREHKADVFAGRVLYKYDFTLEEAIEVMEFIKADEEKHDCYHNREGRKESIRQGWYLERTKEHQNRKVKD